MEVKNASINLNQKYNMLLYDVELMKKTIKDMDMSELLKTCPVIHFKKNTIFYHNTNLSEDDLQEYNARLGKSPQYDEKISVYNFNFLGLCI